MSLYAWLLATVNVRVVAPVPASRSHSNKQLDALVSVASILTSDRFVQPVNMSHVKRKNHWFCVWSVLRFRNLLATEKFEAFAQQMMRPEWFGNEPGVARFSGDTLSEYSGYFTDCLYTRWNEKDYRLYLATHQKHKWSDSLCERFTRLCLEMDEAFRTDSEE